VYVWLNKLSLLQLKSKRNTEIKDLFWQKSELIINCENYNCNNHYSMIVRFHWCCCKNLNIIVVVTNILTRFHVLKRSGFGVSQAIHSDVCLMKVPQPPPKRLLHTVRSIASPFIDNYQFKIRRERKIKFKEIHSYLQGTLNRNIV